LNQQLLERWPIQCQIACAFVADGTDRSQIRRFITAAHGLVNDVADVKPGLPCRIGRVRFPGYGSAHLTCETVAVQNERSCLFRDATLKCRDWLRVQKKVLPRLQIAPVIVGEDLVALFRPQFPNTSSPLACISRRFPQFT